MRRLRGSQLGGGSGTADAVSNATVSSGQPWCRQRSGSYSASSPSATAIAALITAIATAFFGGTQLQAQPSPAVTVSPFHSDCDGLVTGDHPVACLRRV
jgi:hypothetical protein